MTATATATATRKREPTRGLFRWPGSKRHLISRVWPLVGQHKLETRGRLISLFAGSLAIERACGGAAIAADASVELLHLYCDLQKFPPAEVHAALLQLDRDTPRTPEAYRDLGRRKPSEFTPPAGSARFLWLSAMAFNGVWRVNGAGQMNMGVDRARLAKPPEDVLPPLEAFRKFADEIRGTLFVIGWQAALGQARAGDVVFADPPYGEFDGYTAAGFSAKDHRLLASCLAPGGRRTGSASSPSTPPRPRPSTTGPTSRRSPARAASPRRLPRATPSPSSSSPPG
jgi:DNA adenine methylase